MTKVIAIAHEKGGVGKTTTAINLGIGLARQGKNVLLLDADPQGDLTKCLGVKDPKALRHTIATCMDHLIAHGEEDKPSDFVYTDAIRQHDEGVDFIPANAGLAATEVTLVNSMSRETVLRQYLDVVKQEYVRAKEGAEQVWNLFMRLLAYGRSGQTTGGGERRRNHRIRPQLPAHLAAGGWPAPNQPHRPGSQRIYHPAQPQRCNDPGLHRRHA